MSTDSLAQRSPLYSGGFDVGKFVVKVAQSEQEKEKAYRLRFDVFNKELGEGLAQNEAHKMDIDEYDKCCDHLLLMSRSGDVVGTYRFMNGRNTEFGQFYSQTEFDLSALNIDYSKSVELGRGCIQPEYRKYSSLLSLFCGFEEYMRAHQAKYFFGCASLPLMSADDALATAEQLRRDGNFIEDFPVEPLAKNCFQGSAQSGSAKVPPLLDIYFSFGARVIGGPAYDAEFGCYDMFVYLDLDNVTDWGRKLVSKFRVKKSINSSNYSAFL